MVLMIPEEGSFSLTAYITTPGYQTIIPKGFLVSRRGDQVYIAPLIPQLFYGITGQQLGPSWRQYFSETGEKVILSRVAGEPEVPREELYWRKVSEEKVLEEVISLPTEEEVVANIDNLAKINNGLRHCLVVPDTKQYVRMALAWFFTSTSDYMSFIASVEREYPITNNYITAMRGFPDENTPYYVVNGVEYTDRSPNEMIDGYEIGWYDISNAWEVVPPSPGVWDWVHYAMFAFGFLPLIFTIGVVVANEIR